MGERSRPAGPPSPDRRKLLVALGFGAANALVLSKVGTSGRSSEPGITHIGDRPSPPSSPSEAPAVEGAAAAPPADHVFDRVISGGRVIDPESGYDRVANIGIDGGTITAISDDQLNSRTDAIDATDRVVSPGFIDMISYAPNAYGIWFKIADGVTTNLGMHGMLVTAEEFFGRWQGEGSPCHYGGAYDNLFMRSEGMLNLASGKDATAAQIDQLSADIEQQLNQGWIGASFSPEYTPGMTFDEIKRQAEIAARLGVPCFFHGRYSTDMKPDDNAKTLSEILDVARQTGAGVHVMHITSTGGTFQMQMALDTLHDAVESESLDATCCLYPYNFWATYLGSARFAEGWQERFHIDYDDLVIPGTGERLTQASFETYQRDNMLAAAFAIPEDDVVAGLRSPITMVGSDAILEPPEAGAKPNNHPRAAGCFSRTLGKYARGEQATMPLSDVLRKMTIMPAKRLEAKAPALRKKGRLQRGADADITIFDPESISDRATLENPAQEANGIDWVLVLGQVVKSPSGIDRTVKPGQPIKSVLT